MAVAMTSMPVATNSLFTPCLSPLPPCEYSSTALLTLGYSPTLVPGLMYFLVMAWLRSQPFFFNFTFTFTFNSCSCSCSQPHLHIIPFPIHPLLPLPNHKLFFHMDLWVRVRDGECNLGIPKVHDLLFTYLCYKQFHRRFHNHTHV